MLPGSVSSAVRLVRDGKHVQTGPELQLIRDVTIHPSAGQPERQRMKPTLYLMHVREASRRRDRNCVTYVDLAMHTNLEST